MAEVYFRLGNPNRIDRDRYEWFSKDNFSDSPDITATMAGGKLVNLRCR
jgi:hypothetical protein